ncbi:hypothetical protein bAD24_III13095 [Burkholderia sp. AD24]|nr:hypothetical protein bAD24_III13095 [Burkholderia sp. AD24]
MYPRGQTNTLIIPPIKPTTGATAATAAATWITSPAIRSTVCTKFEFDDGARWFDAVVH